MRISTRILSISMLIMLIMLGMLSATVWMTTHQQTDALIINLAGRERMLAQKVAKELMAARIIEARQENAQAVHEALNISKIIFEATLNALTHGGSAPLTLDPKGPSVTLPPAPARIASVLQETRTQWLQLMLLADKQEAASGHLQQIVAQSNAVVTAMSTAVNLLQEDADARTTSMNVLHLAGTTLAVTLLGISMFFVRRHLVTPLRNLCSYAQALACGRLDTLLHGTFIQELAELRTALCTMVSSMSTMLQEAEANETKAAHSAMEALQASMEATKALERAESARAQGMREAAETLHEMGMSLVRATGSLSDKVNSATQGAILQDDHSALTSEAMEAMNGSIQAVARNAEDAGRQASTTKEKAAHGAQLVQEVVNTFGQVEASSERMAAILGRLSGQVGEIGKIMSLISDIADQTNLLALNAAIEAARAGDAGHGFAVVADEVRKLAEKTMLATKEVNKTVHGIQSLTTESRLEMSKSIAAVSQSTDAAQEAGDALRAIVTLVEETAAGILQIASASGEQSAASLEITKNMAEIATVAKNTTGGMRTAQGIISELSTLARQLEAVIQEMAKGQADKAATATSQQQTGRQDLIQWTADLSVGIDRIDRQHHRLVDMVNNLHHSIAEHHSQSDLGALLIELKEYAVSHFGTEEELFAVHGYPEAPGHIETHRILAHKVLDFEEKFLSGKASIGMDLLLFLKDWLVNHIMKVDKRYMGYLHTKGVR